MQKRERIVSRYVQDGVKEAGVIIDRTMANGIELSLASILMVHH